MQMDLEGIAVSAGSACSSGKVKPSSVLQEMGFLSSNNTRFGFGISLFNDNSKYNYNNHYKSVMNKNILSDFYLRNILRNL